MRVLLIYPHILGHGDIPIAVTSLTAVLRQAGHEVRVFDCSRYVNEEYILSMKESYGMIKPSPPPPVPKTLERSMSDLDTDLSELTRQFAPDIVGVTATTATFPIGLECSAIVKRVAGDTIVIFGGIHPTICPEEVIREDSVDIICIGEGEEALVELCDAVEQRKPILEIANLWIKDKHDPWKITKNKIRPFIDLNTLPPQDFSDFSDYELYRPFVGKQYKMLHTELSRGCVFKCSYCVNHHLQKVLKSAGPYHRQKTPSVAIRQIKELKKRYSFEFIRFWDEDFTLFSAKYLSELAALYKEEIALPFLIYADTRTITEEKIEYLKEMGCATIAMGIESGNYWMRKYVLKRDVSDEKILEKFALVKKSGIRVTSYNMLGLPFETRNMAFDTIKLNRVVSADTSSVWPFKPFPKTELAELAAAYGMIVKRLDYSGLGSEMCTPFRDTGEIDGLIRTFSSYARLPEKFFPLLEMCENDEKLADEILPTLVKHMEQ